MYVKHHSKALYIHPRVQTNATSYILYLRSSLIGQQDCQHNRVMKSN